MVDVTIEKDRLNDILDVVGALVDEAVLEFKDDSLHIEVTDPADVGLSVVDVEDEEFESFSASGEKLGVNLNRLQDIISLAESKEDLVTLLLDRQTRKLEVSVSGVDYTLALIDPDSIRPSKNPDIDLPINFTLDQSALSRGIKATTMVGDTIEFAVEDNEFSIDASGDTDDVEYTPRGDDIEYPDDFDVDDAESIYSLQYLNDMEGAIPSGSEIDVSFADSMPMELTFHPSENTTARYVLAPRIQST